MAMRLTLRHSWRANAIGISAVLLAILVPVGAQSLTGTTSAGLYYDVTGSGEPVVFIPGGCAACRRTS